MSLFPREGFVSKQLASVLTPTIVTKTNKQTKTPNTKICTVLLKKYHFRMTDYNFLSFSGKLKTW